MSLERGKQYHVVQLENTIGGNSLRLLLAGLLWGIPSTNAEIVVPFIPRSAAFTI